MDTFVNPLRSSMRNVSNAVKSFPDSLAEGMTKVSDNMGRMSERLGQDIRQSIFKAGAAVCELVAKQHALDILYPAVKTLLFKINACEFG